MKLQLLRLRAIWLVSLCAIICIGLINHSCESDKPSNGAPDNNGKDINFDIQGLTFTSNKTADLVISKDDVTILTIAGGNIYTSGFNTAALTPSVNNLKLTNTAKAVPLSVKILSVGNSYTLDLMSYLPMILENIIPSIDVTMAVAFYAGSSLRQNYEFAINDSTAYDLIYYTTSHGYWQTETEKYTLRDLFQSDRYDMITFQQESSNARDYKTYQPYLDDLINYTLGLINYPVKLGWLMTPAYPIGYKGLGDDTSDDMYNKIALATQRVYQDTPIDFILPCGTAIQNARHTSLDTVGEFGHLSFEGLHLQEGIGPLASGYTAALELMSELGQLKGVLKDSTRPSQDWIERYRIPQQNGESTGINEANVLLSQKCAVAASKNRFTITQGLR